MLSRVGKLLGMFEIYAKLYPSSQRLKERIVDAYASFLECCLQVKLLLYEAKPRSSLGTKTVHKTLKSSPNPFIRFEEQ